VEKDQKNKLKRMNKKIRDGTFSKLDD